MMPDMGTTRRFQFSLGMLLAFIAGMAVMLAVLLPFTSLRPVAADPHAGLSGLSAASGMKSQQCASCHVQPLAQTQRH